MGSTGQAQVAQSGNVGCQFGLSAWLCTARNDEAGRAPFFGLEASFCRKRATVTHFCTSRIWCIFSKIERHRSAPSNFAQQWFGHVSELPPGLLGDPKGAPRPALGPPEWPKGGPRNSGKIRVLGPFQAPGTLIASPSMSSYAFHVRAWLNEAQHPCEFRWCSTFGCSFVQVLSLTYTLLQTVVNSDWIKVWEGAQSPFGGPLGHLSGLLGDSCSPAKPLGCLLRPC